jgi:uncharacterized membrane protein YhhN
MTKVRVGLNYIYPILAMVFIGTMSLTPYPGDPLVKALPILFLAVLVFSSYFQDSFKLRSLLIFGIGLLFSAGGDIALALKDMANHFVLGLGSFLIAQVFYTISFILRPRESVSKRKKTIVGVIAFGSIMAFYILPSSGGFLIPVTAYLIVISTMACFAGLQKSEFFLLLVGAVLFMVSDGIIAVNKFVTPVPEAGLLIMGTYYLAQWFLARGILAHK